MAFKFLRSEIPDVVQVTTDVHGDERGFFCETFKSSDFRSANIHGNIVQVNHSKSQKDVLRGIHFQREPKAQGKLITVAAGEIFDVAVDIRKGSKSYGQWVGVVLDASKKNMLFIPRGFAHGFCVLSGIADIIYYCTDNEYSPEHEGTIVWNDPDIKINWPTDNPILSERDKQGFMLKDLEF